MAKKEESAKKPANPTDFLQPFLIDHSHIRGQLVQLNSVAHTILERHKYPQPVSHLLAEMLVIATMLSSNLKSGGVLTIQARGDGPIKFLVVDATAKGNLRGYAELPKGSEAQLLKRKRTKRGLHLREMLGKGYLAITLDQGVNNRYQGIVELAEGSFTDAIKQYFTQSQQVQMDVKIAIGQKNLNRDVRWVAGGIMIERLPKSGGKKTARRGKILTQIEDETGQNPEQQWRRTRMFMETVTPSELIGGDLTSWDILRRLFNEDGVWAFRPRALTANCRCSRKRVAAILKTIPQKDLESLKVKGRVEVKCQFCGKTERFDSAALKRIYQKKKKTDS